MHTSRPTLPTLTVNRQFMLGFTAEETPCLALGLVEEGTGQCADRAAPEAGGSAGGFRRRVSFRPRASGRQPVEAGPLRVRVLRLRQL
jgi:hypothetical protein